MKLYLSSILVAVLVARISAYSDSSHLALGPNAEADAHSLFYELRREVGLKGGRHVTILFCVSPNSCSSCGSELCFGWDKLPSYLLNGVDIIVASAGGNQPHLQKVRSFAIKHAEKYSSIMGLAAIFDRDSILRIYRLGNPSRFDRAVAFIDSLQASQEISDSANIEILARFSLPGDSPISESVIQEADAASGTFEIWFPRTHNLYLIDRQGVIRRTAQYKDTMLSKSYLKKVDAVFWPKDREVRSYVSYTRAVDTVIYNTVASLLRQHSFQVFTAEDSQVVLEVDQPKFPGLLRVDPRSGAVWVLSRIDNDSTNDTLYYVNRGTSRRFAAIVAPPNPKHSAVANGRCYFWNQKESEVETIDSGGDRNTVSITLPSRLMKVGQIVPLSSGDIVLILRKESRRYRVAYDPRGRRTSNVSEIPGDVQVFSMGTDLLGLRQAGQQISLIDLGLRE